MPLKIYSKMKSYFHRETHKTLFFSLEKKQVGKQGEKHDPNDSWAWKIK